MHLCWFFCRFCWFFCRFTRSAASEWRFHRPQPVAAHAPLHRFPSICQHAAAYRGCSWICSTPAPPCHTRVRPYCDTGVSLVSWVMSVIKLLGMERGFWVHIINRYIYLFIIWALLSSEIVNDTRDTWHSRHWLGRVCLRVKIFYGRFLAIDSLTATEMLYLCSSKSIVR